MSKRRSHIWKTLPLFSIIFAIVAILLFFVALAHYWQVTLKERTDFENNQVSTVLQGKTAIEQQLSGVVSDINYLATYGEHYRTSNGVTTSLFDRGYELQQQLTRLLQIFSKEKKVYDQIRFLDIKGAEIIRINYNNGTPYAVPTQNLQTKSSRYYFEKINKLKRNELYISPLDLNIEKGKIDRPFKPVLRFSKTVYNSSGEHKGSLLLNFMGEQLLQAFRDATKSDQAHIMLLNHQSYWLSNTNKTLEWGFMFGLKNNTFSKQYPTSWLNIQSKQRGQFYTDKHLITFTTVNPLPISLQTEHSPQWKIVSLIPQTSSSLHGAFSKYVNLYGSILLLLGFGSWLLASTIIRHRQSELQVVFEQRFRQVLEHVDLLAVGLDKHGTVIFSNKALSKLTGWSRDEMQGKEWFNEFIPESYQEKSRKTMHDLCAGKITETHEDARIKTKKGEIRRIDWNHTLMKNADGNVIGMTCIGENVTEIREQEKQLLTLSRAIEQSPVVVLIVDTRGGIEYVNPRFTEVTGYTMDEVRGKNPNILKSEPHTNKEEYDKLWITIKEGGTWHGIFKNRKKDNEIYWASASISGLRDSKGNIVNYIGVQEDITERLSLEKKFRMSVEGSPYAMVMINDKGEIILINSRTEEYFGYNRDELMGQHIEILLSEKYQHDHVTLRNEYVTTAQTNNTNNAFERKLFGKRKSGEEFPIEVALNLIDTDEGKITLASIIDITQRSKLEAELEQRKEEIAKSKTLAVVGRMASMVAHDLRNPLSSIKMSLQILSRPTKTGKEEHTKELKKIALEQVSYMEVIMEDLLNYARPPALKPEWLDMNNVINETINMLQGVIQNHNAEITIDIQQGLPTIYADSGKLRLILSNLLSNAIQAAFESEQKPEILISAMSHLGDTFSTIKIEISDNGPGINDNNIEQLFEPFFTSRAKGTGLGLTIVKGFVEQHKGKITLHSKTDGDGSICTILLPISELMTKELDELHDSSTKGF